MPASLIKDLYSRINDNDLSAQFRFLFQLNIKRPWEGPKLAYFEEQTKGHNTRYVPVNVCEDLMWKLWRFRLSCKNDSIMLAFNVSPEPWVATVLALSSFGSPGYTTFRRLDAVLLLPGFTICFTI